MVEKKAVTIRMTREKETKNTIRFQEQPSPGNAPVLQTLYLQKWLAGSCHAITVTIELE